MSQRLLFALSTTAMLLALPALAEPASETGAGCPEWFPDFQCERQGRPDGFIPPITMPYYFEEPFVTTGVSSYVLWHEFPDDSAFAGGDTWVVAVQARVAITDRLAFIATKDGYAVIQPDGDSQLHDENGFLDISGGFKYLLVSVPEKDFFLTPSLRIEAPVGQNKVFSGNGDGVAVPGISAAWGIAGFHVLANLGARVPFANSQQTTSLFYNAQLDYALWTHFSLFFSVNGLRYMASGNGKLNVNTKAFGGVHLTTAQDVLYPGVTDQLRWDANDVMNLGSEDVTGNNIVTLGVGGRVPINRHVSLGAAYEFPVTSRKDIFERRVTMNLLVEL